MRNSVRSCWIFAAVLAAFPAVAQEKACSPAEMAAAEKAVDRVTNWMQLYKAWQDYRHCDKGSAEDVFTDALLRCLVEWKGVETLAKQVEGNADYRAFVERHIKSPAAKDDLQSIYSRAKMSCPKGLDSFCADIAAASTPEKK